MLSLCRCLRLFFFSLGKGELGEGCVCNWCSTHNAGGWVYQGCLGVSYISSDCTQLLKNWNQECRGQQGAGHWGREAPRLPGGHPPGPQQPSVASGTEGNRGDMGRLCWWLSLKGRETTHTWRWALTGMISETGVAERRTGQK